MALFLFGPEGAQIYADTAGSPMVTKGVTAKDPLVTAFAEAAAAGFPRPQIGRIRQLVGPVRRCRDQGHGRQVRTRRGRHGSLRGHEQGQRQVVEFQTWQVLLDLPGLFVRMKLIEECCHPAALLDRCSVLLDNIRIP